MRIYHEPRIKINLILYIGCPVTVNKNKDCVLSLTLVLLIFVLPPTAMLGVTATLFLAIGVTSARLGRK